MWIRSQDRELFVKVNGIGITVMVKKAIVWGGNVGGKHTLAWYSSKERAIEELDRIYKMFRTPPCKDNFVYQMREEDEG